MPDLKTVCKPCPNMIDELKPRKIMNRLPDLDMWIVCEDGCVSEAEAEMSKLLEKNKMYTSDKNPLSTLEEVAKISEMLKQGERPDIYLPIDAHIIEYSKLKDLIIQVPEELSQAKKLNELGYIINVEELDKIDAVTKAHISLDVINNKENQRLLLKNFGHIPNKGEFIETVMNENCPAYVKKETVTPKEASDIIKSANGKVVLAHPVAYIHEDGLEDSDILNICNSRF